MMMDIKSRIETGSSMSQAFRAHPAQFDSLYCNLVAAGEASGTIDAILERLATYKEKILALKAKIKSAMFYPISVIVVAIIVVWVIMVFVVPAFKEVFTSFGADLPAPTLIVMAISDFFVSYWYIMFAIVGGAIFAFITLFKRSRGVPVRLRPARAPDTDPGRDPAQGDDRTLDAHAVDDVRSRRAARRVARRRRRRVGQRALRRRHPQDPDRRRDRAPA